MRPYTAAQATALGLLAVSGRWLRPLPGLEAACDELAALDLVAAAWGPDNRKVYCLTPAGARAARQLPVRPIVIDVGGAL